jgi:hypothetical protein
MTDAHDHQAADQHEHDHHHHDHEVVPYPEAIRQFRAEKDDYFRHGDGSPLPAEQREGWDGLPYYPVEPSLRFDDLTLDPYTGSEPARFQIPTSDGKLRPAQRAGVFRFPLGGVEQTLTAYTFEGGDSESVFVPFLDTTSGKETYGAGRYLDLYREEDGTFSLDFNLAYHPSCVYDPRFSCPLTPPENRLPVPIEAGERLPADAP